MTQIHPGSIQARVGAAMAGIELNIEQQDLNGVKNFTDLLVDYVSCYFPDHPEEAGTLEALEAFNWANATESEAWQWLRTRRRLCVAILRKASLFGYKPGPEMGSAVLMEEVLEA